MKNKTYFIDYITPGSTCLANRTRVEVNGTYQDAVNKAHEIFQALEKKTGIGVHSDKYCLYFWHRIDATGKVQDRNTNSGVTYRESYPIKFENNAYRDAA